MGRARRRSQPGEACYGPEHHERVCLCPRAALLTRSSGEDGDGGTPLPARQGPPWPGVGRSNTCVCAPLPSRCLAYVKQLLDLGGRYAAPRRARPGMGRSNTCVCATALELLG